MKRCGWLNLAGFGALAAFAPAAEIYVDAGSLAGAQTGSPQSPFRTVQAAIDAAAAGDEIRIAAGTYVENLRVDGKAVRLLGGYASDGARNPAGNPTTLRGAGGDAVINLISSDSTIDGFRITGGTGSIEELPYGYHGGGIYSRDGSPTISNNIIEGNDVRRSDVPSDYHFGGGVHVSNAATATIVNNVIRGNFAGRGGGMSVVNTEAATIQGNIVEHNVAVGDHGGGLFIAVVNARITQNVIRSNEVGRELTYGWGGGLILFGAGNSAEISFNVLSENFAAGYGAAEFIDEGARATIHHELIYRNRSKDGCEAVSAIAVDGGEDGGSRATIRFCTVVGNVCEGSTRGNGLQVELNSVVSVRDCIFWNNGGDDFATDGTATLTVTYTNSQEGYPGTGNLTVDPMFVNEAADDYRLVAGSACIDAGDPSSPFGNEPAPNGGRADLGRYGNAADAASSPGLDLDVAVDNEAAGSATTQNGNGASHGDQVDTGLESIAGSALCPSASAMLLSFSLIGVRRSRRTATGRESAAART